MSEFFRGRRRKIGVLTLMMALLFMAGWIRSLVITDALIFPARQQTTGSAVLITFDTLFSIRNTVVWTRDHEESTEDINEPIDLGQRYPIWKTSAAVSEFNDDRMKWQWRWCGFGIGKFDEERQEGVWETFVTIPYWSIVMPLTLISAWLLVLSKPRPDKFKTPSPSLP